MGDCGCGHCRHSHCASVARLHHQPTLARPLQPAGTLSSMLLTRDTQTASQFILNSVRDLHLQQADDLLFFVRKAALATSRRNRLIVRRKGQSMPHDCAPGGELAAAIDWPRSALLNMVLQTPYCLSVSACRCASVACLTHAHMRVTQCSHMITHSMTVMHTYSLVIGVCVDTTCPQASRPPTCAALWRY